MKKPKHTTQQNDIILHIPRWAAKVHIALAVVLLPWTIYLSITLPERHLSAHWSMSWVGLDIGLMLSFTATAICAYTRSIWIVIAASCTGALLLVDAWFDVLSERNTSDVLQAFVLAICFEIPLALLSFYLATHALRYNAKPEVVKRSR